METNATFSSVLVGKYASAGIPPQLDYVVDTITSVSIWTVLLTLLAVCVAYDQCM